MDGAAAIAKTVIGLGNVREDPGVFGRDVEGRVRCGDGLFAKFVFRVVGAEHGQNGRFLGIQRGVLLEKVERPAACRAHLFVILEPNVGLLQIGPNAPIFVVELQGFASGRGGFGVALLIDVQPPQVGVSLIIRRELKGFRSC